MHPFQETILALLGQKMTINYKSGLRSLGRTLGTENPQNVKHHLEQLEKNNQITISKKTGEVTLLARVKKAGGKMFNLPIIGVASCSPGGVFVDQKTEGYVTISQSTLGEKSSQNLFVVRAMGDSMNRAQNVRGGTIENGDYVIVNSAGVPQNGDYVLSIINNAANIKRFYRDDVHKEIRLLSESTIDFPPIILSEEDLEEKSYFVNGVVVRVVKKN